MSSAWPARRLLQQAIRGDKLDLERAAEPVVYVPESLTGMELLENFRASSGHMALVVDEYGEIQGLVTAQDLFEAIAGEFKPQRTEDAWAVQRADGSWLLDGLIPIPELKDRLNFGAAPEEELGRYNTLSGMVMLLLGRVPATGDIVEWRTGASRSSTWTSTGSTRCSPVTSAARRGRTCR
jgi:putative hemolysin